MSFTDQKPFVVTEEDASGEWSGGANGKYSQPETEAPMPSTPEEKDKEILYLRRALIKSNELRASRAVSQELIIRSLKGTIDKLRAELMKKGTK